MANKENESETNYRVSRMGKYDALGNMFMQMREARGLTQAAVAENLMSQRALSNFETQGELPNRLVLNAIVRRNSLIYCSENWKSSGLFCDDAFQTGIRVSALAAGHGESYMGEHTERAGLGV